MNQAEKSLKWKSSWDPISQTEILSVVGTHFHLQDPRLTWQKRRLHGTTEMWTGAYDWISSQTRGEQLPFMAPVLFRAGSGNTGWQPVGLALESHQDFRVIVLALGHFK